MRIEVALAEPRPHMHRTMNAQRSKASILQLHPAISVELEEGRYEGCLHALAGALFGGRMSYPDERVQEEVIQVAHATPHIH